jgi:hypothetical protein
LKPRVLENTKMVGAMAVELRPVDRLAPNARNARTHTPEQVNQIAVSLRAFRWTNPVRVDEGDGIVAGHAAGEAIATVGGRRFLAAWLRPLSRAAGPSNGAPLS